MAGTMPCPGCKKDTPKHAATCPSCGQHITNDDVAKHNKELMLKWFAIIGSIIGIAYYIWIGVGSDADTNKSPAVSSTTPIISEKTFPITAGRLADRFNVAGITFGTEIRMETPVMTKGPKANTASVRVTGLIQGVIAESRSSGNVRDVTLILGGDGSPAAAADILLAMSQLIQALSPDIDRAGRAAIMRDLGITDDDSVIPERSSVAVGAVNYVLRNTRGAELLFIAEPL